VQTDVALVDLEVQAHAVDADVDGGCGLGESIAAGVVSGNGQWERDAEPPVLTPAHMGLPGTLPTRVAAMARKRVASGDNLSAEWTDSA
jgi:hypothetical protein